MIKNDIKRDFFCIVPFTLPEDIKADSEAIKEFTHAFKEMTLPTKKEDNIRIELRKDIKTGIYTSIELWKDKTVVYWNLKEECIGTFLQVCRKHKITFAIEASYVLKTHICKYLVH